MTALTGKELAEGIRQKNEILQKLCAGIDEATASRSPAGRWTPKEILSHLWGPEKGHLPILQAFLDQETPRIDIDPGNPFFSQERARMTFRQLLAEVGQEYDRICTFAEGLSVEQLERKAHIPKLKDSPLTEYPTLEAMIGMFVEGHIQFHTDHLREILEQLGNPAPQSVGKV
jgi:hypothetical protein